MIVKYSRTFVWSSSDHPAQLSLSSEARVLTEASITNTSRAYRINCMLHPLYTKLVVFFLCEYRNMFFILLRWQHELQPAVTCAWDGDWRHIMHLQLNYPIGVVEPNNRVKRHCLAKFLCPSQCKFPKFSKTPPTFLILMILKRVTAIRTKISLFV